MKKLTALAIGTIACSFAAAQFTVYNNGVADGVNGWRPTANWDPNGVIDDFQVPSTTGSGTTFDTIRVEIIDGTTGVGISSTVTAGRIRIYALGGGTLAGLDFNTAIPVYDQSFSVGGGNMTKTLAGITMFGRDLEYFDFKGPSTSLAAGRYGLMYNVPGAGPIDHFWATSTAPAPGETPDIAAVFGPGLNSAVGSQSLAFKLTAVPEPGTMAALGLGLAAIAARRRRKKA
jgi:hypothetical protein